jgi:hypothetical protein
MSCLGWQQLSACTASVSRKSTMQVRVPKRKRICKTLLTSSGQKYKDFGEELRLLAINLDLTCYVVQLAQGHAAAIGYPSFEQEHQVLGNFRETLSDCECLLDDQRFFTKCDGFVSDVSFYYQIDDVVQKLRDRIALHNINVNRILKTKRSKKKANRATSYPFFSKS